MTTTRIAKIALEEAFNLPDIDNSNNNFTAPNGAQDLGAQLVDIHEQRLKGMDENGISYMILSLTSPGAQDHTNPEVAQALAKRSNDYLAGEIRKNPARFGGFAALSMHDPKSAALEARRAIKELGFHGLLVNDFQSTGADGEGAIFYDQPEWDIFWEEVEALDNISITTSGHYGTPSLLFAIQELGIDRVMFSIDYPYETIDEGAKWFDSIAELTEDQKKQIAFGNAEKLLKLSPFPK
ncbi:hypothetical protein VE03_07133 [Pseudogymnoascus sp. 23342-1-I1]|nr:hypothetical protein VE03_07133 [Pseudogymnoascus sp. 23342-1-I1]